MKMKVDREERASRKNSRRYRLDRFPQSSTEVWDLDGRMVGFGVE
jgi:hypothetical protein